jgi:hypothetical protein
LLQPKIQELTKKEPDFVHFNTGIMFHTKEGKPAVAFPPSHYYPIRVCFGALMFPSWSPVDSCLTFHFMPFLPFFVILDAQLT